ncbi:MAG: hypothetical protein WCK60_03535 [Candidatus Nomurabacteria bacterium]
MAKRSTSAEDKISVAEFREFLFDRIVLIEDVNDLRGNKIYKSLQYWRRHGLLPFFEKGEKFQLSFAQLVWLRILDHLRESSFTVKKTEKICNYFFKEAYDIGLPQKNLEFTKTNLLKKKLAGTLSEEEENSLQWVENALNSEMLLYGLKYDINYLTNLINNSLAVNEEAGILVFMDGEVMEHIGDHYFNHHRTDLDRKRPHIYFSLSYFLEEFIEKEELQKLLLPRLLSDDEKMVLKEIRTKNVKELTVKFNDGVPFRFDVEKEKTISGEEVLKLKKALGLGNYEEITLVTRNEKTIVFKTKKKKYIR